jgi:hypothetical protein
MPRVDDLLSPLLTVVPKQLLGHHIAAYRGLDVDQPWYIAKSVTFDELLLPPRGETSAHGRLHQLCFVISFSSFLL